LRRRQDQPVPPINLPVFGYTCQPQRYAIKYSVSVRIRFLWVGKTRDRWLSELEEVYLKRLEFFLPTERVWVPEQKKAGQGQISARMDREAQGVERRLKEGYLIVLDEGGRQFTSLGFAQFLEGLMNRGAAEVNILVGGFLGIPDRIKARADMTWSLGMLTLPHELARVVVLEQVYRSMSIIRSLPYHK
jgi:23S rRNA (pseudouridine1915-N3)-methyltransferase